MSSDDMFICPHCGEEIRPNARACPHCGSDENTGWSPDTYLDSIVLPDDDEYEELRENEFGTQGKIPTRKPWVLITAIIVLVIFCAGAVAVLWR